MCGSLVEPELGSLSVSPFCSCHPSHSELIVLLVASFEPASGKHAANLLSTNTEVSIAPKSRKNDHRTTAKSTQPKLTSEALSPPTVAKSWNTRLMLRVIPSDFFSFAGTDCNGSRAWVSPTSFRKLSNISGPLENGIHLGCVDIRTLQAPLDPSFEEGITSHPQAASSRVIHTGETAESSGPISDTPNSDKYLFDVYWSRTIPDQQIIFDSVLDGIAEWNVW